LIDGTDACTVYLPGKVVEDGLACGGAEGGKIGRGATADQCDEFSEIVGIEEEAIFAGADEEGGAAAVGGEDGAGGGHGFEGDGREALVGGGQDEESAAGVGGGEGLVVDFAEEVDAGGEAEAGGLGFEGGAVAAVGSDDGEIEARELGEGVEQMVDAFDGVEAPDEEEGGGGRGGGGRGAPARRRELGTRWKRWAGAPRRMASRWSLGVRARRAPALWRLTQPRVESKRPFLRAEVQEWAG
jgi:hypothetical protein